MLVPPPSLCFHRVVGEGGVLRVSSTISHLAKKLVSFSLLHDLGGPPAHPFHFSSHFCPLVVVPSPQLFLPLLKGQHFFFESCQLY